MSELDRLLENPPKSVLPQVSYAIMVLLVIGFIWALVCKIDEYAVAEGEVVPREQIQTIQHLEGGIIEQIHVQEGMHVKKGQELIQLNVSAFIANKEELQVRLQGLKLKRFRLTAEARGEEMLTIDNINGHFRPGLLESEQQVFEGNRKQLASQLSVLREQVEQKGLDVVQLEAEKNSISKNLGVLREKLRISQDLVKDQLTSKLDHLQLQSEVQELTGRLQILQVAIPRAKAVLQEAHEKLKSAQVEFQNKALAELREVELEIAQTEEVLTRATDQVQRTTVKSPINGVVKSLQNHTLGGVVKPGEVIMEIVPESENLVIEARLNPKDIGFIKVGQEALVKIQTYDYSRFGGLIAEVISVSADSYTNPNNGEIYFKVVLRTEKNYLGEESGQLPITAGMQATVDIVTGSKTLMQFLLKPIFKVGGEAFRER